MSFHPFDTDYPDNPAPARPQDPSYARPQQPWPPAPYPDIFYNQYYPDYDSAKLDVPAPPPALPVLPALPPLPVLYPRLPYDLPYQFPHDLPDDHPQDHPQDHLLVHPADPVKDEPYTPTSPQFIFEFPGGEDEPPPFDLAALPPSYGEHSASSLVPTTCDSPALPDAASGSTSRTRPGSPTTEAMKSMMSVFRVDPFSTYDADSGTRRKRRKRGSTYARTTDPEASSREQPLLFTFQLDVHPPEWAIDDLDDPPDDSASVFAPGSVADHAPGGMSSHDLDDLYTLPSPDPDGDTLDYPVFDDPEVAAYRIHQQHQQHQHQHQHQHSHASQGGDVRISRGTVTLSMPIPLPGALGPSAALFDAEAGEEDLDAQYQSGGKFLPTLFNPLSVDPLYPAGPGANGGSSIVSQDAAEGLSYTSAPAYSHPHPHSRQSTLTPSLPSAESDTQYDEAADVVPPSTVSLLMDGAAVGGSCSAGVPAPLSNIHVNPNTTASAKRSRSRPPTKMHICWICHKEFPRPSGLATHMNTHSGAKRSCLMSFIMVAS
jgi:hypothetical protein